MRPIRPMHFMGLTRPIRTGLLVAMACLALLPVALRAQYPKIAKRPPGGLAGEVLNSKGVPVAGALILWQVADGDKPHVLHSDAHGHFRVGPLHSGLYNVRASKGGVSSEWSRNLLVKPGGDTTVTLRLKIAVTMNVTPTNWGSSARPGY
jgi:hypothetical protein